MDEDEEKIVIEPIDYEFLNGLRGIGALVVYFLHFSENRYVMCNQGNCDSDGKLQTQEWWLFYKNSPF